MKFKDLATLAGGIAILTLAEFLSAHAVFGATSSGVSQPITVPTTSTLQVFLNVDNTFGGSAVPAQFKVKILSDHPRPSSFLGNASGTTVLLNAYEQYHVNVSGLPGYSSLMDPQCNASGLPPLVTANCHITMSYTGGPTPIVEPPVAVEPTSTPDILQGPSSTDTTFLLNLLASLQLELLNLEQKLLAMQLR